MFTVSITAMLPGTGFPSLLRNGLAFPGLFIKTKTNRRSKRDRILPVIIRVIRMIFFIVYVL
jgi:hypothetical protein